MTSSTIKNLNQGGIGIPFDFALHFVSSSLTECREPYLVKQEKVRRNMTLQTRGYSLKYLSHDTQDLFE